jgi:hypothetical protein
MKKTHQLHGTTAAVADIITANADRWHSLKGGRGVGGNGKGICAAAYAARPAFAEFAARFIADPTAFNIGLSERTAADAGGFISLPDSAWIKLTNAAASAQKNSSELREWLRDVAIKKLCASRVWFALCRDAAACAAVFGAPLTPAELAPYLQKQTLFRDKHGADKQIVYLFEVAPHLYAVADGEPFSEYGARVKVGKRSEDDLWAAYAGDSSRAPLAIRQPTLLAALRRALAALRRDSLPKTQPKRRKKANL